MPAQPTARAYRCGAVGSFVLIHLGAAASLFGPFSMRCAALVAISYAVRMFGVTAGYHRYFSHRSFKLGRAAQFVLALLAQTSGQKGVLWWEIGRAHV